MQWTMLSLVLAEDLNILSFDSKAACRVENLGYEFANPEFLQQALTHRSWCAEFEGVSNERLEFLGDAVLGLVVTQNIYLSNPDIAEGQLAKIRSSVVSANALSDIAGQIGLGEVLMLGKGEESSGGRKKASILADAFEAVIGAVYLDGGILSATQVIESLFEEAIIKATLDPGVHDYKTRLQELSASHYGFAPIYEIETRGPDHDREFLAMVRVDKKTFGPGSGTSKKRAEQEAARLACQTLSQSEEISC